MTVQEALDQVREVGSVQVENGRVKLRFPETERSLLAPALALLRANRETAIEQVSKTASSKPTLADIDPEAGIPYCEWKAQQLNRLFLEHGATPHKAGNITAATVQDGMLKSLEQMNERRNEERNSDGVHPQTT